MSTKIKPCGMRRLNSPCRPHDLREIMQGAAYLSGSVINTVGRKSSETFRIDAKFRFIVMYKKETHNPRKLHYDITML
jgi:hypothetical protein